MGERFNPLVSKTSKDVMFFVRSNRTPPAKRWNMELLLIIVYLSIGMRLAHSWFETEYEAEFLEVIENDDELDYDSEEHRFNPILYLLVMTFFWPIKLVYNILK